MSGNIEHGSDALATLLRRADAASPPPPVQEGLVKAVRRASRRRHNRRVVAGGCALVLAAASAVAVLQSSRDGSRNVHSVQPGSLPAPATPQVETLADYKRANYEAVALARSADRLLAAERRRQRLGELNSRAESVAPTQTDRVASLRAVAALTLISQADRLKSRADSPLDALATYRRAAELFPDTPWAGLARQRIEELQSHIRNQEVPL
jgi:hypothetical protein